MTTTNADNETMHESDREEEDAISYLAYEQHRTRTLKSPSSPIVPIVRRGLGETAPFALEGEQIALIDYYSDTEWKVFLVEADNNGDWEHPRCEADASFDNRAKAVSHGIKALKEGGN